ncbi:hypothetical protein I4U23_014068 [Adineta vaga]|nr:hypothetical protein I4U23_014068 [Adineta vaga]
MNTDVFATIIFLLFLSTANTLDVKIDSNSNTVPATQNVKLDGIVLKVAMYPYLPDSGNDKFANLLRFIQEEFKKIEPNVTLQLRPLISDADFYSLTTLTSWLSSTGNEYDVVEIDTVILGEVVSAGLIAPQFSIFDIPSDWHPAAASAVQMNQAVYGYPHLMCGYFLFTRDEQVAKVTSLGELADVVNRNVSATYRLIGNLNSSWELPALWINSYLNSNHSDSNVGAFALHAYRSEWFEPMRKLAQLCERVEGENDCMNGLFKDNTTMTSILFARKQTMTMFGYSERLFHILKNADPDDFFKIKMIPLPSGTTANRPSFFTDAFVFRHNMSDDVLKAARAFVEFMGTPRMQAAVVGREAGNNGSLRYLLPMSSNAYNEPPLVNDRFYQQYFRNLSAGHTYPTVGFINARKDLQAALIKYIDSSNHSKSSSSSILPFYSIYLFLLLFIFLL